MTDLTLTSRSDYYPKETDGNWDFVSRMYPFYEAYVSDSGPKFAIGEIGNGAHTEMATRLSWLKDITSPETAAKMPHFIACSWFNVSC